MKRIFFITALFIATLSRAEAGLKFGLGSAVAEHDADIIHEERLANPLLNLPACSDTLFSVSPIDLATTFHVDPLGHMSGVGGHMFPTDHVYFYVPKSTDATPTTNVYAPGDMIIYQVASSEYLHASPIFTDYTIRFTPCQGFTGYYFHVGAFSADLQSKIGAIDQYCSTYTDGSIHYCTETMAIKVSAGDLIGTITGKVNSSFTTLDFGVRDHTQPALSYVSPARQIQDNLYTRCPFDRFEEPLQTQLTNRLGKYDGSVLRTDPPLCGETMQDVPSAAQGLWYVPGTPQSPVQDPSPHLALVHDNVLPSTGVFSVGTSMSASGLSGGQYYFDTATAGLVNLDFNLVTANGTVYCYEGFQNLLNSIILVQLTNATTLNIEKQTAAACGAGPWTFTGSASTFER